MKRQWKTIWVKATIWLIAEIVLNLLGLDNLADYSEFLFEKELAIEKHPPQMAVAVPPRRPEFTYNLPYPVTVALEA